MGASSASSLDTDDDDASDSDGTAPPVEPGIEAELCPEVVAEGRYCLQYDGALTLVGLETGATCHLGVAPGLLNANASLAWIDDAVYMCEGGPIEGQLRRIDLDTGAQHVGDTSCSSIAAYGNDVIYYLGADTSARLHVASDIDALMEGTPGVDTGLNPHGWRMGADTELAWVAWHSGSEIGRLGPDVGELGDLSLEDHDGWIFGVARIDGELVVARRIPDGDDPFARELAIFDAASGALLDRIATPGSRAEGIACRSSRE